MKKKNVIKTLAAGIAFGAIVGVKVCLDIYDFGYQTRVKEEMGDRAAARLNKSVQEVRVIVRDTLKKN